MATGPAAMRVGQQLSGLDLSDSDSDNSDTSIFCMCLNSFNRDNWMPDVGGARDDIQVGEADRVNDPADIPWRTTAWNAGAEDVPATMTAKGVGESHKVPPLALSAKTVLFDLHRRTPCATVDTADSQGKFK